MSGMACKPTGQYRAPGPGLGSPALAQDIWMCTVQSPPTEELIMKWGKGYGRGIQIKGQDYEQAVRWQAY